MNARIKVGLDVHLRSIVGCAVDADAGEVFADAFGGSDFAGLLAWLEALPGQCEAVHEAGYCGFALARFLIDHGVPCTVTQGRTLGQGRAKTDALDAEALARLLICRKLHPVYVPTEQQEAQREAARQRYALAQQRKAVKKRLSAFSHRHSLPRTITTDTRSRILGSLNPGDRVSFDSLTAQLEVAECELAHLDQFMSREVGRNSTMQALTQVSGIGPVTAFTAAAEAMDFSRFDTARDYASFLGLVPVPHNSGSKSVQLANHKRTPSGDCFYSAATTVMRIGGSFQAGGLADPENDAIRERLASLDSSSKEYGKTHQAAIIAHCLAEQAWALARRLD